MKLSDLNEGDVIKHPFYITNYQFVRWVRLSEGKDFGIFFALHGSNRNEIEFTAPELRGYQIVKQFDKQKPAIQNEQSVKQVDKKIYKQTHLPFVPKRRGAGKKPAKFFVGLRIEIELFKKIELSGLSKTQFIEQAIKEKLNETKT